MLRVQPVERQAISRPPLQSGLARASSIGVGVGVGVQGVAHRSNRKHHFGQDGQWYSSEGGLPSKYSDFVPYDYDDRTLLTRIIQAFNYARQSLIHTTSSTGPISFLHTSTGSRRNTSSSAISSKRSPSSGSSGTLCGSASSDNDIEMISSSPSPTLHGSNASHSPSSYHGSRHSTQYKTSPRTLIKHPSPAAFPRSGPATSSSTTSPLTKRHLAQSTSSPQQRIMRDASTQYSPIPLPTSPSIGQKRGASPTPTTAPQPGTPPPEPSLRPQITTSTTAAKPAPAAPAPTTSTTTTQPSSSSSSSAISTTTTTSSTSPKRPRPLAAPTRLMPSNYSNCNTTDLVHLISTMLLDLIAHNDTIPLQDGRLTRFHSRAPPSISVKDYLQRLTTHATLAPPILLSMVYYIDRLCALYPAFTISSLTVHRFLITAATVASKGLSDAFWTNNTYARVGGVSLRELALLELEFLWRVEWRIVPTPEVLEDYYRSLVERADGFEIQGGRKGSGGSSSGRGGGSSSGGTRGGSSREDVRMEDGVVKRTVGGGSSAGSGSASASGSGSVSGSGGMMQIDGGGG